MRKTRSIWQYALFLIPVIFVVGGLQYISQHSAAGGNNPTLIRSPASHENSPESVAQARETVHKKAAKVEAEEDEDTPTEDLSVASPNSKQVRDPAASSAGDAASGSDVGFCAVTEFPGKGPDETHVSQKEWAVTMEQFHSAKASLIVWLKDHRSQFSPKTYQWMEAQISDARIERPSSHSFEAEPDVAWRGIAVPAIEKNESGLPQSVIRVGGGFLQWVSTHPQRARFELSRILAQSWAPCAVNRIDPNSPWKDFLNCMNMQAEADAAAACANGSYSEAGWAVSSAIAAVATPPGCRVPAFEGASASACVKKMGAL